MSDNKLQNVFTMLMHAKKQTGGKPKFISKDDIEIYKYLVLKDFIKKWDGDNVKISDLIEKL